MRSLRVSAALIFTFIVAGCSSHSALTPDPMQPYAEAGPAILQDNSGSQWIELLTEKFGCVDALVPGPHRTMWYTAGCEGLVGKIEMSGKVKTYGVDGYPERITPGPDGNLWFIDPIGNQERVAKITPSGIATYYNVDCASTFSIVQMVSGADGNLWFTVASNFEVGKITTSGVSTCYPTTEGETDKIAAGPDGNVWFTESGSSRLIGRITPQGTLTEYADPNTCLELISAGDGNLYCGSLNGVARIDTTDGAQTIIAAPVSAFGISTSGSGTNAVLYISVQPTHIDAVHLRNSKVTRQTLPSTETRPQRLAFGPDGNLWYTATRAHTLQSVIGIDVFRILTISPSSLTLGVGQSQDLTASVTKGGQAGFTAVSSDPTVATITPGNSEGTFTVTGIRAGSATMKIEDHRSNSTTVPVTIN